MRTQPPIDWDEEWEKFRQEEELRHLEDLIAQDAEADKEPAWWEEDGIPWVALLPLLAWIGMLAWVILSAE